MTATTNAANARDIIASLIDTEINHELSRKEYDEIQNNQFQALSKLISADTTTQKTKIAILQEAATIFPWKSIQLLIRCYRVNKKAKLTDDETREIKKTIELFNPIEFHDNYDKLIMEIFGTKMLELLKSKIKFQLPPPSADSLVEQAQQILNGIDRFKPNTDKLLRALDLLDAAAEQECYEAMYAYWTCISTYREYLLNSSQEKTALAEKAGHYLIKAANNSHNYSMLELAYNLAFGTNGFRRTADNANKLIDDIEKDTEFAETHRETLEMIKLQSNYSDEANCFGLF